MNRKIEYTDAPPDIEESLSRAVIVPTFELTPEEIEKFGKRTNKKPVNIHLNVDTIEKFKLAAKKNGSRYQTMISDVLDSYTKQYLSN